MSVLSLVLSIGILSTLFDYFYISQSMFEVPVILNKIYFLFFTLFLFLIYNFPKKKQELVESYNNSSKALLLKITTQNSKSTINSQIQPSSLTQKTNLNSSVPSALPFKGSGDNGLPPFKKNNKNKFFDYLKLKLSRFLCGIMNPFYPYLCRVAPFINPNERVDPEKLGPQDRALYEVRLTQVNGLIDEALKGGPEEVAAVLNKQDELATITRNLIERGRSTLR